MDQVASETPGETPGEFAVSSLNRRPSSGSHACLAAVALLFAGAACADLGSGPETPATIEMKPFPSPSVVLGDTLRDEFGMVAPVEAIVRNMKGEIIEGATPGYLYADFNRDSALTVGEESGIVAALKTMKGADGRIAARIGSSLQAVASIAVTLRPDSAWGSAAAEIRVDPTTVKAEPNTTGDFQVSVLNKDSATPSGVAAWVVRYELVHPANPENDTTAAAWLVDERNRASLIDTTDAGGKASRRVRVRADRFPASESEPDSLVVRVLVHYRGQSLPGTPLVLTTPVRR